MDAPDTSATEINALYLASVIGTASKVGINRGRMTWERTERISLKPSNALFLSLPVLLSCNWPERTGRISSMILEPIFLNNESKAFVADSRTSSNHRERSSIQQR